jgi:hypothetical protein
MLLNIVNEFGFDFLLENISLYLYFVQVKWNAKKKGFEILIYIENFI